MGIDCELLLNKIDDSVSEDDLFKKYSKEELLIGLINFCYPDQKYLNDKMEAFRDNKINISDFRIIIKLIYKYAKNNEVNKELKDISYYEIKEFNEFIHNKYVYVRNFLARCIVKERKIEYDSEQNIYFEPESEVFRDYERISDDESIANEIADQIKRLSKYKTNSKIFLRLAKDQFLLDLYKRLVDINKGISEFKDFKYKIKSFSYEDIIKFSAATQYLAILTFRSKETNFALDDLITFYKIVTKLDESLIKELIHAITYNEKFQNDKFTLFQPLFLINGRYYIPTLVVIFSYFPLKILNILFNSSGEYKKIESLISQQKEKQMIDDIEKLFVNKYKDSIKFCINKKFRFNEKDSGEYDILIFDTKLKVVYIIECKWFKLVDGDESASKLTSKIDDFVYKRINKNKLLVDNKEELYKLFGVEKISKFREFLISQNFIGYRDYKMPVINFKFLSQLVNDSSSMDDLWHKLINKDYYNNFLDVQLVKRDFNINGYRFCIYVSARPNIERIMSLLMNYFLA